MKRLPRALIFLASLAVALPLWAGQRGLPTTVMSTTTQNVVRAAAGRSLSMIQGTVMSSDRSPVPYAKLRLRNLDTGRIEQVTSANYAGDFSFLAHPTVPYVVELVDDAGRVLTTGAVVAAEAGQTAGAMVMLPARGMTLAGLFGNTAGALVAAAASTGITAVTTTGVPQSPEE